MKPNWERLRATLTPLWNNHSERIAAVVAAVFAIIACRLSVISINQSRVSLAQSQAALRLAEQQFASERALALTGKIEDQSLVLAPLDSNFRLQQGFCHFPKSLEASREFISPDCKVSLVLAEHHLQELFAKRVKPEKDQIQYMPYGVIPVIIDAQYVAKNEVYQDRGFYTISYSAIQSDKAFEIPKIEIRSILFVNRVSADVDAEKFIESQWKEIIAQFPRNQKP